MKSTSSYQSSRRIAAVAVFGAMAYVLMLLIHIPVSFLTLDLKDALITLCGLYFGPVSALALSVLVPLLEFATVSTTGAYGLIMNVLGSLALSIPSSLIYRYHRSLTGAIVGLISAVAAVTGIMLLANLWITPYFLGVETSAVVTLIPKLLLPFNLVKALLNAGIVLLLYKQLAVALRRTGFLPRTAADGAKPHETHESNEPNEAGGSPLLARQQRRRSLIVSLVALLIIAASLVVIFAVLGGDLRFGLGAS